MARQRTANGMLVCLRSPTLLIKMVNGNWRAGHTLQTWVPNAELRYGKRHYTFGSPSRFVLAGQSFIASSSARMCPFWGSQFST